MSRGFVKEDDLELAGTDLPERPVSEHPNYVTPQGLNQLEQFVEKLANEHRALSPKSEDPTVGQKLASIERDLRYYEARLEQAILVEASSEKPSSAVFGTAVTVEDENGDHHRHNRAIDKKLSHKLLRLSGGSVRCWLYFHAITHFLPAFDNHPLTELHAFLYRH